MQEVKPFLLAATELLSHFEDGSLTVEQYAKSLLSRIASRDDQVEAWVHLEVDHVIQEAIRLDSIPTKERGALHGVAVAVKDIFYTKDMPTTFNSPIYQGSKPEIDAGVVAILRQAGALLMGKTTTTEFASMHCGPKTHNPHNFGRTPGGSSSGSAAAVADFQATLALGSQTAGSTIRPGSFNGIYSFKPTWNSVTREGLKYYAPSLDTVGLFARSVDDIELLCRVLAIGDDIQPREKFSIPGARFAILRTTAWDHAEPDTAAALETGAGLLRDLGAEVDEIQLPPEFDKVFDWQHVILETEARVTFLPEYRIAREKLQPGLIDHVENRDNISRKAQLEAIDGLAALRPLIDSIAGRYAAIITPSATGVAPVGLEGTGNSVFNKIWTALHTPVINIPGFKGESDMPIGLSLVAPRYHDRDLLAVAREVGPVFEAKGGWTRNQN